MPERFYVETLGCPKNQVDSDKLAGSLLAAGLEPAARLAEADLVVVNTCAFIEDARVESVEAILDAAPRARRRGARLVVTGCLAARSGEALADALPEVDAVIDVGVPVELGGTRWRPRGGRFIAMDFLDLPRPASAVPWAYVKVAEGCDRRCGFCAIPQFRGPQRSRAQEAILAEVDDLGCREIVLVAQDLASYGRDLGDPDTLVRLVAAVAQRVSRVRLLYLYPQSLDARLIDTIFATGVPYFDLSLQHVARPLLRRMRRFGSAPGFLALVEGIRTRAPGRLCAARSSSATRARPRPTTTNCWVSSTRPSSTGSGSSPTPRRRGPTPRPSRTRSRPPSRPNASGSAPSCRTRSPPGAAARSSARSSTCSSTSPGAGRSYREAPEIDGVIHLRRGCEPGTVQRVRIEGAVGPDLDGSVVGPAPLVSGSRPAPVGAWR